MAYRTCDKGCCRYKTTKYKNPYLDGRRESSDKKAGILIIDKDVHKIVLVQSHENFWGLAKGSMKSDETKLECAIRETWEETGLLFEEDEVKPLINFKGRAYYYICYTNETPLDVQTHVKGNDANSIGWFSISCIEGLVKKGHIRLNFHCRYILSKFFNLKFPYVKNRSCPSSPRFVEEEEDPYFIRRRRSSNEGPNLYLREVGLLGSI